MQPATIIPERLSAVVSLAFGSHDELADGMCAMEAVGYIAGEPWSDHPQCACPVIASFMRTWNDNLEDDDRNRLLLPLIPRLVGSRATKDVEHKRSLMAADWLVRTHTPAWLRLAGLNTQADALANLPEIKAMAQVPSIRGAIEAARDDASAAWDAAWAAAGDAAWDAAGAAAGDAAMAAAMDAAWAAARAAAGDAARDAAGDAAGDAAWAKLRPTVDDLQTSGVAFIERMLAA